MHKRLKWTHSSRNWDSLLIIYCLLMSCYRYIQGYYDVMMISRRLVDINWSFLCLGVCLLCLLARGNSEPADYDFSDNLNDDLNEILNSLQNKTWGHLFVISVLLCLWWECVYIIFISGRSTQLADGLVTEIATNISLSSTLSLSYFSLIVVTISRTGRKLDFSYLAAATLVRGGLVAEWLTC